jgi:ABC-type uncharacterized transport system involved in gliding motility auxiliary subunit
LSTSTLVEPNIVKYPDTGFAGPADSAKTGSQVLAVAITGGFTSGLPKPSADDKTAKALLPHSPKDTRIVVFGSSAFVSDDILGLAQQLESDLTASNVELVHNAVDWSLADTDLLSIRSHNTASRALTNVARPYVWRWVNLVIAIIGLALVIGLAWLMRRAVRPVIESKEAA